MNDSYRHSLNRASHWRETRHLEYTASVEVNKAIVEKRFSSAQGFGQLPWQLHHPAFWLAAAKLGGSLKFPPPYFLSGSQRCSAALLQ